MQALKDLRKARNLTQDNVAEFLGVSKNTISRYENGEREPDHDTLLRLAGYFDVSVDFLLTGQTAGGAQASGDRIAFTERLFAAYGGAPPSEYTEEDIEDLATFMRLVDERKKRRGRAHD